MKKVSPTAAEVLLITVFDRKQVGKIVLIENC